ncbi:MAG: DUF3822 family protein, partial [Pedobacter sp.]
CRDVPAELSQRLKTDSYLAISFKEVKASVYTESAIAIPSELFSDQTLNDYAKFFPVGQSNNLYTHSADGFGFKSIFTLSDMIDETISSSLSNCRVFDHSAPVLSMVSGKTANTLQLDFTAGSFNAVYTVEGKLIFQKYIETENAEEFNYYLLFIISQLKISTEVTEVYISGIIHQDDAYYNCIAKYFKTINFHEARALETNNKILDDMPAHYYSSLLAIDLCE